MLSRAHRASRVVRRFGTSRPSFAKILASDPIDKICADVFHSHGHQLDAKPGLSKEELIRIIPEYQGLVVRSGTTVTADIIQAASNLKIIGRAGTGVDNIDVPAATKAGILVVNVPGGNTTSTAELALTHILALARNIPQAVAALKAGRWDRKKYTGTELTGKVLGIVGVGRIGREVAKWCNGFGMTVIGYDPLLAESTSRSFGIEPVTLEALYQQSDFITFHTPLTPETKHLLNPDTIKLCKMGVRIINCARGGIIDEEALLVALKEGQVGAAALDVFEEEPPAESRRELVSHPNLVVTPHLGASTKDAQLRVSRLVAQQMCDIFAGGDFVGVINAPNMGLIQQANLVPHVLLAERIGGVHAQLLGGAKVRGIVVNVRGAQVAKSEIAETLKSAVLKGALGTLTAQQVNYVNASAIADDLGLSVTVNASSATEADSGFSDSISVSFEIEGMLNATRTISGTVFGGDELRITNIDGYEVDLPPAEHMLFFNNIDRPGVLRQVAARLAKGGINIAHFSLGRKPHGNAMGALVLDEPVPPEVFEEIKSLRKFVSNVAQVYLPEVIDPVFRVRSEGEEHRQGAVYGSRRPSIRPRHPEFSSGPCKKRPGYDLSKLRTDVLGRSHRSKLGKARLKRAIDESKRILGVPDDYLLGIVPASDTGAFEMAMWGMLGPRPVSACYWESFGQGWYTDAKSHLKLETHEHTAEYGQLPDLTKVNMEHDVMFTWNGTTSGVKVPNADWIPADRKGLTFNDATSAAFAMDIQWDKVDVTTYSWQKVLGGEGAHGVLVLSPRAVERLETFKPVNRPLPKIFRMLKKGKLDTEIFEGSTINTPSMLCVEDYIDALGWADSIGGLKGLINKSHDNLAVLERFVDETNWIHFLAKDPASRSNTSVCVTLDLNKEQLKKFVSILEKEKVAYDIGSYRDAPPGLRIWCGATVDKSDLEALLPWLSWAYETVSETK